MASLTTDRNTPYREGALVSLGMAANAKIYAGGMVALDTNGYAVAASDTAGLKVIGRAEEQRDNTGGADGDMTVLVREGVFRFTGAALTVADVGKPCFVSDDQTISAAATTNNVCAGIIEAVDSATEAWVRMGLTERAGAAQPDIVSAAAGAAYTAAEQALINEIKAGFNSLLAKLRAARLIAS